MPVSSKEFLDIQATIECKFTLKCVYDTIKTNNLDLDVFLTNPDSLFFADRY